MGESVSYTHLAELISMTEWLDEQEILSNIALDYRVKSLDSILLKYDRYYPNHQTRKVFNDIPVSYTHLKRPAGGARYRES